MNYWRMAFKCGSQGFDMREKCFEHGVAAITYEPFIHTDLSNRQNLQNEKDWQKLAPAQKASFRRFLFEMKKGDVIYAKSGKYIAGKGVVKTGKYNFVPDTDIICPKIEEPWCHHLDVDWEKDFIPFELLLGAEQFAVYPLDSSHLKLIESEYRKTKTVAEKLEAEEGETYKTEVQFRKRNRALIEAKKANSDGNCEVCGFNYRNFYKGFKKDHLVAHHLIPLSKRNSSGVTTMDDIALVCPNCHTELHTEDPPISVNELKKKLKFKL